MKFRMLVITIIAVTCLGSSVYIYEDAKHLMNEIQITDLVKDERLQRAAFDSELAAIILVVISTTLCVCAGFMLMAEVFDEKKEKITARDRRFLDES